MVGYALMPVQAPLSFVCNLLVHNHDTYQHRLIRKSIPRMMCAANNKALSSYNTNINTPFPAWSSPSLILPSMSYSSSSNNEECALPPDALEDNFSRYSKYLVKNSNGVDGMGGGRQDYDEDEKEEQLIWVDTLGKNDCAGEYDGDGYDESSGLRPRPFSVLSWNILAQSLYESQYKRKRITQVALSTSLPSTTATQQSLSISSPHPHPWKKRVKRIIEILAHSNADIICLQECELQSFKEDVAPALSNYGYEGIAQEDDRPIMPTRIKEVSKHRGSRNHICATFWKKDKFEIVGDASVRTRTLTTILREHVSNAANEKKNVQSTPTVAVINVHLEGHPRRFSERTHQLQHSMTDIAKRIEYEKKKVQKTGREAKQYIGKLNALVLAGDFNCELQSSACSTYLKMGRLGRQGGLGGCIGEDALVLPPSLLETTEATSILHPIMEWGRALPEESLADVPPHPFRRNGMTSAYPPWLGRDDAESHFTFCSELSKRPVPGLDQIWFTSMTLERVNLRNMFVNDSGLWERYFYDDAEVAMRREEERRKVLASGLPSFDCDYPSDHLPIAATFDWKWDDCADSCLLDDNDNDESTVHCVDGVEVRGLNVIDSKGNNVQDDAEQNQVEEVQQIQQNFDNPHDELHYLLQYCPYDSQEQQSEVQYILSPLNPPISPTAKDRPTSHQLKQLDERRDRKAVLLKTASLRVRPWLKNIWKANKKVNKWDRHNLIQEAKLAEKAKC